MRAKKSFGQNWLRDEYILTKIVESAAVRPDDVVLEVGPGLGTLTEKLLETNARIVAVEADRDLIPALQKKFIGRVNFELIQGDILKFDLSKLDKNYKVVANIPYYLTSNLIRLLLESTNAPNVMVLLVQKEVANRILAGPGDMSVLAFSVQYYAKPEFIIDVRKELFEPIPKVDSAVLKITRHQEPVFPADIKKLFRLVKAGFGEKRKTLRNSLSGGLNQSTSTIERLLDSCGIDFKRRAQELSMAEWHMLYNKALAEMLI